MQESLVKLVLVLTALASLLVGGAFLIIPVWIIEFSGAQSIDVGWLRSVGASTVGVQGFGLLIAAFRRRDTNPLVGIVALATTIQVGVLWYSLFTGEYGEMSRWATVTPAILGTIAGVLLWFSWISRRRTVGELLPKGQKRRAGSNATAEIGEPEPASAELVEEIDSQSPRFENSNQFTD